MKRTYVTSDFDYTLPVELIAKYPLSERAQSRLMIVNGADVDIQHRKFTDLIDYINPNDLLIFNDTKVIPARLFGAKNTGGKIECLIERIITDKVALAHVRASKAPKVGSTLIFANDVSATVLGREEDLFKLEFDISTPLLKILEEIGEIPIPPYLERDAQPLDSERYQTIFADKAGAVAAPTAALHFDQAMLDALIAKGVDIAKVTLHVGAGTFLPLRTENFHEHVMHKEYLTVSREVCDKVERTRAEGGQIIAVGTTVVRCLETAAAEGRIQPYEGDTQLFITPGYQFRVVDRLLTNFHLPKSTLLMLVCAFGGYELLMCAYQAAVANKYRFFSYGDAMLI